MFHLSQRVKDVIQFFRGEASDARTLASTFSDKQTVTDLEAYASGLECEIRRLEAEAKGVPLRRLG